MKKRSGPMKKFLWIISALLVLYLSGAAWIVFQKGIGYFFGANDHPRDRSSQTPIESSDDAVPLIAQWTEKIHVLSSKESLAKTSDGSCLRFKPGALNADADVTIIKRIPESEIDEFVAVYDIDISGAVLKQSVQWTLPIERPAKIHNVNDMGVFHFDESKKLWEPLTLELAPDHKSATVSLKHFSRIVKVEPGSWSRYFEQNVHQTQQPVVLEVPYYNQGNYGWCWAASLAMIEGFYGNITKIWQIASYFRVNPDQGATSPGKLADYLRHQYHWEAHTSSFWMSKSLNGYLIDQINQGHPIWLAIPYASHAIAVVGYDQEGVYIHDPSGMLLDYTVGKSLAKFATDNNKLGTYYIRWALWDVAMTGNFSVAYGLNESSTDKTKIEWSLSRLNPATLIFPNYTLVVRAPDYGGKAISLQLMPGQESFNIIHQRFLDDQKILHRSVEFYWNAKEPQGYTFVHCQNDSKDDQALTGYPCNSDHIQSLTPFLSNTSNASADVEIRVLLDLSLIVSQKVTLPARTSHWPITLTNFRKNLNLSESALPLGDHPLTFELYKQNTLLDRAEIIMTIAPETVRGVSMNPLPNDEIEMTWTPNREEHLGSTDMVYHVWRTVGMNRTMGSLLGTTQRGVHKFKFRLTPEQKQSHFYYSVWAYDAKTGLSSQDASFHQKEEYHERPASEAAVGQDAFVRTETIINPRQIKLFHSSVVQEHIDTEGHYQDEHRSDTTEITETSITVRKNNVSPKLPDRNYNYTYGYSWSQLPRTLKSGGAFDLVITLDGSEHDLDQVFGKGFRPGMPEIITNLDVQKTAHQQNKVVYHCIVQSEVFQKKIEFSGDQIFFWIGMGARNDGLIRSFVDPSLMDFPYILFKYVKKKQTAETH